MALTIAAWAIRLFAADPARAQEPPPRPLPAVADEHPDGVSSVAGLAELPDGRVLVSDAREGMLRLFSFDDASLREVASHGRGPREYLSAGGLYRQRNGEVWLLDALQRRYLVLSSRGDARRTLPFAAPPTLGVSMRAGGDPHRVDGRGQEYERARPGARGAPQDSAVLLRRRGARTDTVAWLRNPEMTTINALGASITTLQRFSPSDGFAVAEDGSVAVVRADPYGVEWREAAGRIQRGPVLATALLPVTAADRDSAELASREAMQGAALPRITETLPDGTTRDVDLRSLAPSVPSATHKPAFDVRRVYVDRDGRLWVGRQMPHGAPTVYDVFDTAGVRIDRVQLAPGYRLVGFGVGRVYVARSDEDGLLFLGRVPYAPPAAPAATIPRASEVP
ncbi:MAG: hypothetical protein KF689_01405 [Gemmatimonadaceae bacterium]|nr:hypothetical protein [Gemmatimonadaceae bacterium]MCW5826586.1 hypothetical protein [Gemmatimonadaceae bacterium]